MAQSQQRLPCDAQELVEISRTDDLRLIRSLLESKNQKLIFEHNAHLSPAQFQTLGTAMLFIALERNSDLVFGALRFLNVLHRLQPTIQFRYTTPSPVAHLQFGTGADHFATDFLMTLYACAESPFNGARPEALTFFSYWARCDSNAHHAFVRIATTWPWTNRNKYYFLSILADAHGLGRLLRQFPLDRVQFTRGLALSLQYRNLISPGQTLAITLARQEMPELFAQLAYTLRDGPRFEAMNCLQHWMRCVSGTERVFELLELGAADLLSGERFEYLRRNGHERLVMFRACFRKQFERAPLVRQIDAIVEARSLTEAGGADEVAVKLAQLDVIIANTIARPADIVANLGLIVRFMRYTMHEECTALRQSILKLVPNLLYVLAPLLRRAELEGPVRGFFRTLRVKVFESGLAAGDEAYQPIVFAVRLYEVVVKTLHGSRADRIIKRFSEDVNGKLRAFLEEEDTWRLLSEETYSRLLELLSCEFDDVRDIACELLVRFFPANDIHPRCVAAARDLNIYQCGKAKLLARVAVAFESGSAQLATDMRQQAAAALRDYGADPLWRMRSAGGHLFGALDAIGVCYAQSAAPGTIPHEQIAADIRLAEDTAHIVLGYLQFGADSSDEPVDGSASFERMDENLTQLVRRSEFGVTAEDCEAQKQWLLLSLWSALRAAGDLAASVAQHQLDSRGSRPKDAQLALVVRCYQLCSSVLLRCRHKGAIEAAGLALGRIVRAVTARCAPQSVAYAALADSVPLVFGLVEKTDTTRRGAGLSIMVHHLVRNERSAGSQRPLMDAVMRELLQQGCEWQRAEAATPEATANRDNRLAAVLHFLGTLVKDGDLRNALSAYSAQIFRLAMAAIESPEWTVRNAALQLVGAFVPKLVGQTQFFSNDLVWQPVYMVYGDVRRKQAALHEQLEAALRRCDGPSVQLVTLLELLARCEVLDVSGEEDAQLRELFYACLRMSAEKVRTLAARCLARFCQWYEVPAYVRAHCRALRLIRAGNFMHGVLRSLEFMLLKWESDSRCMPMLRLDEDRADGVALREEVRQQLTWRRPRVKSYYLRCYVFDVMLMVGCDRREAALMDEDVEDVEEEVRRLRQEHGDRVGFEAWAEKVVR